MSLFKNLSIFISLLIAQLLFTSTDEAVTFEFHNKCPYTVWPAFSPEGGRQLDRGQLRTINVPEGTPQGRVWARTNCTFDSSGRGKCQTGDCNGLLQCKAYGGDPPNTLVEYTLNQSGNDFFDMSLVDGFNVPIEFSPTSNECTRSISCIADIEGQCPNDLRTPGGCNNPCTFFKTDQYCCNSGSCGPTTYSRFFKQSCPDAYSYPMDDQNSILNCLGGTNYKVVFCPDTNPIAQLATEFDIRNNCPFTVWAAAVPGGGQRLDYGGTWRINASNGVRIWGRTNCNFDISTRRGHCQTGDCNGLLQCQTYGKPPNTLAEYSLNQFNISLVNGFNIPMKLIPTLTDGCSNDSISCTADITGQCPKELRTPGGCNDPCTVFNTDDCCTSGNCGEIDYSRFFNERCPNSLSYPRDAATTNNVICPSTTNYQVVFCP